MRKFKKILGIVTILMLVLTMLPTSVFAEGSYVTSVSKTTLTVGNTASLTITAKNSAGKFTVSSSNPSVATVSSSALWIDGSHGNSSSKVTIKAVAPGTTTITVNPVNVSDNEYNLLTNKKTITITVKKATTNTNTDTNTDKDKKPTTTTTQKSSDATLKSLKTSVVDLDFNKNTTNYVVNVDKTVTTLGLKAVANHSKAKVEITGDEGFVIGENIVKVKVTAENGATKTYTIKVIKGNYGPGPLLDLRVNGYVLSPKFDPSIHEYNINAIGITSVALEYKLADKDSKVKIEGADNLKVGENIVKVIVTEEDGTVTTYTVKVNVAAPATTVEEKDNTIWIIVIVILVLFIIAETMYIVSKNKKEEAKKAEAKKGTKRQTKK